MSIAAALQKRLGHFVLDVSFEAGDGTVGLLGASGSGKSMTLRGIAGILPLDGGFVKVDDRVLYNAAQKICLPARKRKVGLLFQSYALFPDMTVAQNVAAGVPRRQHRMRVNTCLELLRLESLRERYPWQLSGGQQQRVALARILAAEPSLLMLDEPFSALDKQLRQEIGPEFDAALKAFSGTVLYVSHDMEEIYRRCENTMVLCNGSIVERGTTKELFSHPKRLETAQLLCCENIAAIDNHMTAWGMRVPWQTGNCGIFGEDVLLSCTERDGWRKAQVCTREEYPRRMVVKLLLAQGAQPVIAACPPQLLDLQPSDTVFLRIPEEKLLYFGQ